jgi:hypothetical protein
MKMLLTFVLSLLTTLTLTVVTATDIASISLDTGYNNHYVVDGVSYAKQTPYAGIGAVRALKYADVYVGGLYVSDGSKDQSHWLVGAGKTVSVNTDFSLRLDGTAIRHQTAASGLPNSTELSPKLALQNDWVTPYIRGSFNLDLEQNGYFVGAERVQKLPFGFTLTPAVEWGRVTDYDAIHVKGTLAHPFTTEFGTVTPFVDVGWFDSSLKNAKSVYANNVFDNTVVYNVGLRVSF